MMAEKKVTKKENLLTIRNILVNMGREDLISYVDHELELLDKKNLNKTPSKNQIANEGLKNVIVEVITNLGKPSTISDIQNANIELAELSNQKISSLLTQLVKNDIIVRTENKKKAYFSVKSE